MKNRRLTEAREKLAQKKTFVERVEIYARIASAIAIPFVLAIVGWKVQDSLAKDAIKKDYVGMAITILREPAKSRDPELALWAAEIIQKNSPIPWSKELRNKVINGALDTSTLSIGIKMPEGLMKRPIKPRPFPEGKIMRGEMSEQEIVELALEYYRIAMLNEVGNNSLIDAVKVTEEADKNFRKELLERAKARARASFN
jgi:hypothetical protein